jgi:predicted GIY-YIG superfamily endonuclease
MKNVYILQSLKFSERYYIDITGDLEVGLEKHKAGDVSHTSKYRPWRVKTYIAVSDERQALVFERYLKTASGRAFLRNRRSLKGHSGALGSPFTSRPAKAKTNRMRVPGSGPVDLAPIYFQIRGD